MEQTKPEISQDAVVSDEELRIYKILKPYIGHCLTLNHDINNPLAGIIGYCEFLLADTEELNEDHVRYLEQILHCGERIHKLVESLCDQKIALGEKIDLRSVTEEYKKCAKPLD